MRTVCFILISTLLLYACRNETYGELKEVFVDIGIDFKLQLSEITEEITAIELELTDESMINPDRINKVHLFDNLVFISEFNQMLVFDMEGKFIRSIGSKGQGPGEYLHIKSFTVDEQNKIIYIIIDNNLKIIGYDLNGKFVKELTIRNQNLERLLEYQIYGINYFNEELLLLVEHIRESQIEENKKVNMYQSVIYKINNDLQFTDSCFVRDVYYEGFFSKGRLDDYLTCNNSVIYLYYPESTSFLINFTPSLSQRMGPIARVLRDTLYRFENNRLIPELKLKFQRNGRYYNGDKNINLRKMYRSSRYIFVEYETGLDRESHFHFCYDTKTGISYNTKYKQRVDIYDIEEKTIRPVSNNTELFYYFHTHMESDDLEEPNPTLYIGKLKK